MAEAERIINRKEEIEVFTLNKDIDKELKYIAKKIAVKRNKNTASSKY